jgi:excisionase family DNA binding protein
MFSITQASRELYLPRDTLLDAVRDGSLRAVRDRRGILRIDRRALHAFVARQGLPRPPASDAAVIPLGVMRPDRLALVQAQTRRLRRESSAGPQPRLAETPPAATPCTPPAAETRSA